MTQFLIRPAAAADIEEAFLWYEKQRARLGHEFLTAVSVALDAVRTHPDIYPIIHRGTRRILLRRFPYGMFYRIYPDALVVIACMHGRRDPRRWTSRA